jgi:hypothetical protein
VALATGQDHPVGLALNGVRVYWTNRGSFGAADAELKSVSKDGGTPLANISGLANARDLTVGTDTVDSVPTTRLFWTNAGLAENDGRVLSLVEGAPEAIDLAKLGGAAVGVPTPEGIAARGQAVYFTSFSTGAIYLADARATPDSGQFVELELDAPQNYPYRIAVDDQFIYWTNEGNADADPPDGSVVMAARSAFDDGPVTPIILAGEEQVPRALALDFGDGTSVAQALYYTTFSDDGAVKRVDLTGSEPGEPEIVASGQSFPNGLAVDGTHVYWTNRGDGTINRLAKGQAGAPTTFATGQLGPGPIVVDDTNVYWANEGASEVANGSIYRIAKPQ